MIQDFSKLWELRKLVQEFEKLDKDLITTSEGRDFDYFINTLTQVEGLKTRIQEIISHELTEPIDPSLANKLQKIRYNFGYNIDKIFPDENWRDYQKEKAGEKMWEQYLEKGGEEDVDYYYLQRINEI